MSKDPLAFLSIVVYLIVCIAILYFSGDYSTGW